MNISKEDMRKLLIIAFIEGSIVTYEKSSKWSRYGMIKAYDSEIDKAANVFADKFFRGLT
jgi:hypothetical protein